MAFTSDDDHAIELENLSDDVAELSERLAELLVGQKGTLDEQALADLSKLEGCVAELTGKAAASEFDCHVESTLAAWFQKAQSALRTDQVASLAETAAPLLEDIVGMLADMDTIRDRYLDDLADNLRTKTAGEVLAFSNKALACMWDHEVVGELMMRYIGEVAVCNAVLKDKLTAQKTLNRK